MELLSLKNVIDPERLLKLSDKEYRDEYMQAAVRSSIPYQIKTLREEAGISQKELAKRINTTQSVISRLENTEYGRVHLQTLLDVACAMDVGLLVRFVSYPDFLDRGTKFTPEALRAEPFAKTTWIPRVQKAADQAAETSTATVAIQLEETAPWPKNLPSPFQWTSSPAANQNITGTSTLIHATSA